jgi:hypothetical protein
MLTEEEYARQARELGRDVHLNDGIWWERHYLGYCKPVFEFRPFSPGQARPKFSKSFLGYSHQVSDGSQANRVLEVMALQGDALRSFSLDALDGKKRNQVRKGLKNCEVRRITNLRASLEDVRQINISQAERQMETGSFGKPARYYTEQAEEWKREIELWFRLPGREWWGAFVGERLGAYMITFQVEAVRFMFVMKTHSDFLRLCLTDAIYFTVLKQAAEEKSCQRVINGGPMRDSLDRYKEQFLFRRVSVPYFTHSAWLFRLATKMISVKERLRQRLQARNALEASFGSTLGG